MDTNPSSIIPKTEHLQVSVVSPQEVLYSGEAQSVSSKNSAGNFDILPEHAHFITIIENSPITVRPPEQKEIVFNFPLAIIETIDNQVKIFAQLPTPEID